MVITNTKIGMITMNTNRFRAWRRWRFSPSRKLSGLMRRTIPIAIGMNNHKFVCGALNRHFCQTRVELNLR